MHTGFIDQHFDSLFPAQHVSDSVLAHAVAAIVTNENLKSKKISQQRGEGYNPFVRGDSFRLNHAHVREFKLEANGKG